MKTLIAYASKFGCTETCAQLLQESLGEGVTLVNLGKASAVNPQDYDCIAIGGSIYAGKIQPEITKFCQDHLDTLLQKRLGLFLCCANADQMEPQMKTSFDARLFEHASAREHFGHEFKLEKMGFAMRLIVRAVAKVTQSESKINSGNIEKFAAAFARQ